MQNRITVTFFHGVGIPFSVHQLSILPFNAADALVKVSLATICGSDLHTYTGLRSAPTPCILGHEAVGQIAAPTEARDAEGNRLHVGDRVTWSIMAACGRCTPCVAWNLPQKCDHLFKYGHARCFDLNGGFAEYICLRPGTAIYRIPEAITDVEAVPLNCALATVIDGLSRIESGTGENAVVLGAGLLGVYATCVLRERGYKTVAVVDKLSSRLRVAETFGATHTFDLSAHSEGEVGASLLDLTEGRGADLVVEVSGAPAAFSNALAWLRYGGQCLTLGYVFPHADVAFDAHQLVTKCLSVYGNHNYHPRSLGDALAFVASVRRRYPFAELIGASYPLRKIQTAFERSLQQDVIRVALYPD